ncbi:hypothetical protein [Bradyrhizobium sp. Mp27]|uniref:hypothetical protein n=1 Tax=Bradyrhizobium sp. Mp27 TaxID=3042157 RepID=UPI00248BE4ED|nr:hypothetical protein [Bradyrhizobium sp. Mp27]MDI2076147.1 hypothetical protein [Bradyrhizobium sp. Mp27]
MTERLSHQRTDPSAYAGSAPAQPSDASCLEPTAIPTDPCAVVDTWPDIIPVTHAEIDVLETFLGVLLDEILGGTTSDR